MPPSHITVTAPPDRVTPVHSSAGIGAGGAQLRVTADVVARVRFADAPGYSGQGIRRSIARGDLIMCDMDGAPVASADLAAAPDELPDGVIARPAKGGKAKS